MAVANHNALPMYQVNSDLFYEQVFIFLPLFQFSPHLYSAKPVCPGSHRRVSLQIQHLSGETVQSSKFFTFFVLNPGCWRARLWPCYPSGPWGQGCFDRYELFRWYICSFFRCQTLSRSFQTTAQLKRLQQVNGWNGLFIVNISLHWKLINNCRKACL